MATTPEGRIKIKIKKVLDQYKSFTYVDMPVPGGYGKPSLDFIGSACHPQGIGLAFAIEAKRPGGTPTPRQRMTARLMQAGGIKVFVIDGDEGCAALQQWLHKVTWRAPGT